MKVGFRKLCLGVGLYRGMMIGSKEFHLDKGFYLERKNGCWKKGINRYWFKEEGRVDIEINIQI